jgi:DNA polymerase III sliding clamp (beta) subunit (PCNA family)
MEHRAIDMADAVEAGAAFNIERAALARAVDFLAKRVIKRRNSIPILSYIMVDASPCGTVTLMGTDLDQFVRFTVPAAVDVPGRFTVEALALSNAIRKAGKGALISLAHDVQAGRLTVAHGRARMRLTTLPVDDFPVLADPAGGKRFIWSIAALRSLASVAPFASTEEQKYYLNGVNFDAVRLGGETRLCAVATDGQILAGQAFALPDGADGLASSIVPSKVMRSVLQLAERVDGLCSFHFSTSRVAIEIGDVVVTSKLIDGTFPDWLDMLHRLDAVGQPLMMAELEPRLNGAHVAAVEKAAPGPLAWECGTQSSMVTCDAAPDWFAFVKMVPEGRTADRPSFKAAIDDEGAARACNYLADLARKRGLDVDMSNARLQTDGATVLGLTVGEMTDFETREYRYTDYVERLCYETFTTSIERVERIEPARPAQYADGAYSIVMPRGDDNACIAAATYAYGDHDARPLRTNARGDIEFSADAVRAMAGPLDPSTFVHIPKLTLWRGAVVAIDGVPTAAMPEGYKLNHRMHGRKVKAKRDDDRLCNIRLASDAKWLMESARDFDAIRPLTDDERANQMPVSDGQPQPEISPVERVDDDLAVSPAAPVEAALVARVADDATAFAPEPVADDALCDRIAALEARIVALEAALVARAEAPAIISAPTIEAANLVARPSRAVRERLVRLYLRMRAERDLDRRALHGARDYTVALQANLETSATMARGHTVQIAELQDRLKRAESDGAGNHRQMLKMTTMAKTERAKRGRLVRLALALRQRLAASRHALRHVKNYEHEHAVAIARCQTLAADLAAETERADELQRQVDEHDKREQWEARTHRGWLRAA